METEQAMQEYIACINVLDPEGSTKVTTNLFLTFQFCDLNRHDEMISCLQLSILS